MGAKEKSLEEMAGRLMTMKEASAWITNRLQIFGLEAGYKPQTLRKYAEEGKLEAVKKGFQWFTREQELREFLRKEAR